jgi:hypothetical protein
MLILQVRFFHPIGLNGWHLSCLTKKIGPQRLTHCRCHTLVCVAWLSIFACWFYFKQCFILPEPHTSEITLSSRKFSNSLSFLVCWSFSNGSRQQTCDSHSTCYYGTWFARYCNYWVYLWQYMLRITSLLDEFRIGKPITEVIQKASATR